MLCVSLDVACDFKLPRWPGFSRTDLYRSVDRLKYLLVLGSGEEVKAFCIVTIAKETTPRVSAAGSPFLLRVARGELSDYRAETLVVSTFC